jgi:hypothetical protein
MKKALLVFVLIMVVTTLSALDGVVGFGWQDKHADDYQYGPYFMRMELEQDFFSSTVYGGFLVEMANEPDTSFPSVSQSFYTIGWSIHLLPFTMTVERGGSIMVEEPMDIGYTRIEITIEGYIR